jgi:transcriptional regulator with XRE-family HTH domain
VRKTLKTLENSDTIGGRIALLVRAKGFRINELASKIGISGQGLRDILSGKSKSPKADVMIAISRELEVSTDWLLHGNGSGTLQEPVALYGKANGRQHDPVAQVSLIGLLQQAAFLAAGGNLSGLQGLQRFSLPGNFALKGEVVAFEVDGDNSHPELKPGSVVICTSETGDMQYLRSGSFYAVVFGGQLTIARVNNKVHPDQIIELQTGVGDFSPIRIRVQDIERLYRVHLVLQRI